MSFAPGKHSGNLAPWRDLDLLSNIAWQTAANEAAREVVAIREKADIEVKAVARRLEEATSNTEQLESEADADATRIETLERQLAADKAAVDAFSTCSCGPRPRT